MKIIHVITSFALGGAERVACDLAAGQVARGHDVTIVALRRTPVGQESFAANMLERLAQKGVGSIDLKGRNFRDAIPWLILSVLRILKQHKPDILHAHADPAELVVSVASRIAPVNVVRSIHNTVIWPTHPVIGWIAEHAFKDETVIAVSGETMMAYEQTRKRFGMLPALRRKTIFNGVPLLPIVSRAAPGAVLKLAFFGRNTPQKGIDILSQALHLVSRRGKARLHIDLYTDAMEAEVALPSGDTVTFSLYPPTPKAREIMVDYDLLVVPSRFEGLGLVPMEAMASSVPVIMTDAPGLREITPPHWPLQVPLEDADALADKIDEVGAGQHDLVALGLQGRHFVEQFNVETQIDNYVSAYREMLA